MPQLNELIKVNTIYDLAKISFIWYNAIQQITDEKFKELMAEGLFTENLNEFDHSDNGNDFGFCLYQTSDPKYEWKLQHCTK